MTSRPQHRVAVVTTARNRRDHLDRQRASLQLAAPGVPHVIVDMGGTPIDAAPHETIVAHQVPDGAALPLAAARNAGAACADAEVIVFLDVDCLATDELVAQYVHRVERYGGIWSGPVGYLPPASEISDHSEDVLMTIARFHDARPRPGQRPTLAPSPDMFWSLSFALDRATWERIGGFDEHFLGYGGEDTDFARTASRMGVELWFDGHAVSFHQHHPVSSPPVEHLDDIVVNSRVFHDKWGEWPMPQWLDEFSRLGLIDWSLDGSEIVRRDGPTSVETIPQQQPGRGIIG